MCGIAGFKCFGTERPSRTEIENLVIEIMDRGTDATGVAYLNKKKKLCIVKAPIEATKFIKTDKWKKLDFGTDTMIFHTRQQTQGDAKNNMNNPDYHEREGHPLCHGNQRGSGRGHPHAGRVL